MNDDVRVSWRSAKQTSPNAVVFVRNRDIYFLLGDDVETAKRELGIRCFGAVVGFNTEEAWYYMRQLAKKPLPVLRVESSGVWPVSPNGRGPEPKRPKGTFIALDARTLFDATGLESMRVDERLYSTFLTLVQREDFRALREHGELYVFEVFGGYDVDWELTTMLPSRGLHLARAALDTGRRIPCRLVLPRAWRGRRKPRTLPRVPKPQAFGQMRLEI